MRARLVALAVVAVLVVPLTVYAAAATEAPGDQLPGPEPTLESTFAPTEYEAPWTWWMGVGLAAVGVLAAGGTGLGYYLLVYRPRREVP